MADGLSPTLQSHGEIMSNQNECLPEAPSAQCPHPAQIPAAQGEEIEQEAPIDASPHTQTNVTEASAAAASGIASVDGPYATKDDTEGDEAFAPPTQSAPGKGDSHVAGSATAEVYPPSPGQGSLHDTDAHAKDQKMQRELAKPSTSDLPPSPEEVPIEDPCEHRGHVDESREDLRTGKKRNRATEGIVADANETKSQADYDQAASSETQDVPDIFGDEPSSDQRPTAPQTIPGAVAVPGIYSNNDDMEFVNRERPDPGAPDDTASDIEAVADFEEAIGAHVVNNRGQEARAARNTRAVELLREHMFASAPLISARAVNDQPENDDADVTSCNCFPRAYSRRTWAMVALFVAIIVAAATLMGVFIPQESTAASQKIIQGSQPSTASSYIPTNFPSLLPSLNPTFDPETLRFRTIQAILVPISGLDALLDTSTPQYRALEWISLNDTAQLPYNTEAERKRVVQRYVLALLYYACGGQHWRKSLYFLEGIHECDWYSWFESDGTVSAWGALCTKGRKSGVGYLDLGDNNMTGTLPAELQYLTDLEVFEISRNRIGGTIPEVIANLTSLTRLDLKASMYTGTIPSSLGCLSNLEGLWLSGNNLTGTIPESFGNLTSLQTLDLSSNMLNGTVPSVLGQLSSLDWLWLDGNSLTGTIPESFGKLTSLQYLRLSYNMLNGTIPSVLGQLSSLGWLFLDRNRLTGEIPYEICLGKESDPLFFLEVDSLTANGTEFLCECIPVEGLSRCCVVRPNEVGDDSCNDDEPYNTAACGWDGGDCLVESLPECLDVYPTSIGDGYCNNYKPYNTAACGWDGGDCLVEGLPECLGVGPFRLGDGRCDEEPYNTEACMYDGGDCCESTCVGWQCGKNGYDCKDPTVNITCLDLDGLEGCCIEYPSQIGDGYCHPYAPYYTEACKYDQGDCPEACPEGTSPVAGKNMSACCVFEPYFVGDAWCAIYEPYNTAACGWDGGDCCEETCEGWMCGANGYDCKDPTITNR